MPPGADRRSTRNPISTVPTMPPTRWTPTTSSESSRPNLYFRPTAQAHRPHRRRRRRAIAPTMLTAPQAGVIATRPATMPEAAPSEVALPCRIRSISSQASIAAMVATVVFMKVTPVSVMNCAVSVGVAVAGGEDDRADVEAVPAEPQQAGADHRQRQVVRLHRVAAEADPPADDQRQHAAGDTGVDVHDRAAGVVQRRASVRVRTSRRPTRMWAIGK